MHVYIATLDCPGANCAVRQKVKDLLEFLADDDKIREERKKAKKNQNRYQGIGNHGDDFGGHSRFNDDRGNEDRSVFDMR